MPTKLFPVRSRPVDAADAAFVGATAGAAISVPSHLARGFYGPAATLTSTLVLGALLWLAWRHAPQSRRVLGLLFTLAALISTLLADTLNAMPLAIVGVCVLALGWGRRAGIIAILGVVAWICTASIILRHTSLIALAVNVIVVLLFLLLGLAAADMVRTLARAVASAEALGEQRRMAALADFDRILAEDRMSHARALHDDLGQRLTLVGMELDLAERMRERDPDSAWEQVRRGRGQAADALAALRRQVRALSPGTQTDLTQRRIDAALEDLGQAFRGTGLDVVLDRSGDPGADELAYRIIQEGLTNVVRHSDAQRVQISLRTGARTRVEIRDDGHAPQTSEGFGLRHLRDRVEAAGGLFAAGPVGGRGFLLTADYPAREPVS